MALTRARAAPMLIPIKRRGIEISQTMGQTRSANSASGQQSTNRISHPIKSSSVFTGSRMARRHDLDRFQRHCVRWLRRAGQLSCRRHSVKLPEHRALNTHSDQQRNHQTGKTSRTTCVHLLSPFWGPLRPVEENVGALDLDCTHHATGCGKPRMKGDLARINRIASAKKNGPEGPN